MNRFWSLGIVLLISSISFFQKIISPQTHGWIMYTGNHTLLIGVTYNLDFTKQ
jgi:hypothetical protein